MLSRKYYKMLADAISRERSRCLFDSDADETLCAFRDSLMLYLERDNPNFDREKFKARCEMDNFMIPEERPERIPDVYTRV